MNELYEICGEPIAGGASSLGVGFVEACRCYLTRYNVADQDLPLFYSRLSETLLHQGRREEAVECARIAFDLQPASEAIVNLCAWVFSNCDRHREAAAAYERLL